MAPLYQMNKKANDSISIEKLPADITAPNSKMSETGIEVSRELKKREEQ
jgi:hypothetical protein